MGLLETEIKELRSLLNDMKQGRVNEDQVHAQIAIYSQTEKRARLLLQAYGMAAKHGKNHLSRMIRQNLIGDGTVIDVTALEAEDQKVTCDGQNKVITRRECLDRSSSPDHFEQCQQCEINRSTRRLILNSEDKT